MEKLNHFFVLTCAYFPYLFTDLIPSPEDRYLIGWFYNGTIGLMVAINIFVMFKTAFESLKDKIKKMIHNCKEKSLAEARNSASKKQQKQN